MHKNYALSTAFKEKPRRSGAEQPCEGCGPRGHGRNVVNSRMRARLARIGALRGEVMGADPIAERLRPGRLDVGEVRGASPQRRFAPGTPRRVDDHRHRVAQRNSTNSLSPPCFVLASGNSLASSAASVSSSGSGPLTPAAWKRLMIVRTVDGAAPSDARPRGSVRHQRTSTAALRARGAWPFSLLASGLSFDNRRSGPELASRGTQTPRRDHLGMAASSRNDGRLHPELAGKPATIDAEERAGRPRNGWTA